jgi:hypothetical protein
MSANGDSTIEMNERAESADPEIVFQVRDNVSFISIVLSPLADISVII